MNWSAMANAKNVVPTERKQQVISNVDTSLEGTQKYVLRVTGTPFYMTNILDKELFNEPLTMVLNKKGKGKVKVYQNGKRLLVKKTG